jgi:hypothetical protein
MTTRRTRILVVLCPTVAVAAGCSRRPPSRSAQVHQLKKSELSIAEQKYGVAPIPDKSITYQPDVIVVGGGADASGHSAPAGSHGRSTPVRLARPSLPKARSSF